MSTILTTHAGSLPRPAELIEANAARPVDDTGLAPVLADDFTEVLRTSVERVVQRQQDLGIDLPNDGEYGHLMASAVNYGSWWTYIFDRVGGLELTGEDIRTTKAVRSEPGQVRLTSFPDRRDWQRFQTAYNDPDSGISLGEQKVFPAATGAVSFTDLGQKLIGLDIAHLQAALDKSGYQQGFLNSVSPGTGSRIVDNHYGDVDEFLEAWVQALRPEYQAIAEAGLTVQIDAPELAENWDQINPEPTIEDYLAFTAKRVDAINRAIEGIPAEQVRLHLCWGSWHGPHTTDFPLAELAPVVLQANAKYLSFEAGNVRHEHEWTVWEQVELPADKVLVPGVVSHATNVVEHPDLVAQRLERFARIVGAERVIGSTDCGLGGRIHADIAWAKLESLTAGARLVTGEH